MTATTPATHRPSWATARRDEKAGNVITLGVDLECRDYIACADDGALSIVRRPMRVVVGDDDLTPDVARRVRNALTEALELLEA